MGQEDQLLTRRRRNEYAWEDNRRGHLMKISEYTLQLYVKLATEKMGPCEVLVVYLKHEGATHLKPIIRPVPAHHTIGP